jgi:hypothetical protein
MTGAGRNRHPWGRKWDRVEEEEEKTKEEEEEEE